MSSEGFKELLDGFGGIIETELEKQLNKIVEAADRYHPFMGKLYEITKEFILRKGKRLASCSTLMAYQGYTNSVDENILQVCCAVEFYRHAILIHDDIVDLEEKRRGDKTIHKLLEEEFDQRFGWGSAIFLGDILLPLAVETVLNTSFPLDKKLKAAEVLLSTFREVSESQILDLLFEYTTPDVGEWKIMVSKRAVTLFRAAILPGAILANAPEEDLRILSEAAKNFGFAFDIQDDIIDTFASPENYGRQPCGDVSKGKKPLHLIVAAEKSKEASDLLKSLRGKTLSFEEIEAVRRVVRETNALRDAKEISKQYLENAVKLINRTKMNAEAKAYFTQLAGYIQENLDWYK
ncbi:MAG: polyprenyl synthetase family protein [Candidatus Odinarchaeia archaeon]